MSTPSSSSTVLVARSTTLAAALVSAVSGSIGPTPAYAQAKPSVADFLSPASPLMLVSARKADRIAWMTYDRGMRNVHTAAAPSFTPVQLTHFTEDDGVDLTDVEVSDDGNIIVFVRGSAPNRFGWVANPSHSGAGGERAIWAVRATGGAPWRVAVGSAPELSPDGRFVLYVTDGQIYRARVTRAAGPLTPMDTGAVPYIRSWGRNASPKWSPDGSRIAFVSNRENHAFIGVLDTRTNRVTYMAPGVDCDGGATWSPDGKRLAFYRRPGTPFGLQSQTGQGGIGNPPGPAANALNAAAAQQPGLNPMSGCGGGFGGGGGGGGGVAAAPPRGDSSRAGMRRSPGFYTSALPGGYTLSLMVADAATGEAHEFWHNGVRDTVFTSANNMVWAGDHVIFPVVEPKDEWDRWYSVSLNGGAPIRLTTTDGMIEDATSLALSKDGRTLYYCTNAGDIERRHIWAVPVSGGTPVRITNGNGVETYPQPLASGRTLATIYFGARTPASIAISPLAGGTPKTVFPVLGKSFPTDAHVEPEIVITKAADGLEVHNQLFLPRDIKPGEKRPAMVFVHGGPVRQMLPAYHYMQFYHWAYAYNQWLASQGYVVLSVNYRSGVGYGRSFRNAANTQARGNSEYQDVIAGAKYLQARADVDAKRVGIWGLSYGGLLTAEALARNSDIFVAGGDLAGVHLYGNQLDTANLAFKSSAVGAIDGWKSPVFLVHGDDDRNVDFAQTVGLVQLLRARGVYHELVVVPDDLHESMIHKNWIDTFDRMGVFFKRFVWDRSAPPATSQH